MAKLVTLKFGTGSLVEGFPVTLQISDEGMRPTIEVDGKLPPAAEMPLYYDRWQDSYYRLGVRYRLSAPTVQITNVSLVDQCLDSAKILRARFKTWLQSEEFRPVYDTLLAELGRNDAVRIVLQIEHRELQLLPWHLWEVLDRYPNAEVALGATSYQSPATTTALKQRVKILAILGDSQGIDIAADRALLQQLPNADVTFLVEPPRKKVTDLLWEQGWDILFFAGHSTSQDCTGTIFINQTDSLTISELRYALRTAVSRGLKLAIFNSCDGLGLARDLADLHIPQTIVMREPVPDRVAHEFLKSFLTTFAAGESLYLAVRSARERLQGLEDRFPCATWLPVIFQNPAVDPPTWNRLIASTSGRSSSEPINPIRPSVRKLNAIATLAISVLTTMAVLGLRYLGSLETLELRMFDHWLHIKAFLQPEPADTRIVVVGINESDVRYQEKKGEVLKDTSISDASLTKFLALLNQYQASVIGVDLQLGSISTSLENLVSVCKIPDKKAGSYGIAPARGIPSEQVGFVDLVEDTDRVLRRQILFMPPDPLCPASYSFGMEVATRYLRQKAVKRESASIQPYFQLGQATFNPLNSKAPGPYVRDTWQETLGNTQLLINYRNQGFITRSLTDVLEGRVDPELFKGRVVLIGIDRTDPVLPEENRDRWITPYSKNSKSPDDTIAGVEVWAQIVSQIISAASGERALLTVWLWWQEILWIGGWAIAAGLIVRPIKSISEGTFLIAGTSVVLYAVCYGVFVFQSVLVPFVPSLLVVLLSGGSLILVQRLATQQSDNSLFKQLL